MIGVTQTARRVFIVITTHQADLPVKLFLTNNTIYRYLYRAPAIYRLKGEGGQRPDRTGCPGGLNHHNLQK